jgi:glycosyltransferase involved in cell wall biosynthesis
MQIIIGCYRKLTLVPRLLDSLDEFVINPYDDLVFIDDSGDDATARILRRFGEVIAVGGQGYGAAMRAACAAGAREPFSAWLEEDFTFTAPVEIVLQRQPWFPNEVKAGGLVPALVERGHQFQPIGDGLLEHTAFFSGNPSVWRREVFEAGWPDARWSEEVKGRELVAAGYSFALTEDVLVHHDGQRSGKGY